MNKAYQCQSDSRRCRGLSRQLLVPAVIAALLSFSGLTAAQSPSPRSGNQYVYGDSGWGTGLWNTPTPTAAAGTLGNSGASLASTSPSGGAGTLSNSALFGPAAPPQAPAPAPVATPAATPAAIQAATPAANVAATPAAAPAATSAATPAATPAATAAATPAATPAAAPAPVPTATPAAAPAPRETSQQGSKPVGSYSVPSSPAPAPEVPLITSTASRTLASSPSGAGAPLQAPAPAPVLGPALAPGPTVAGAAAPNGTTGDQFYSSGSGGSGANNGGTSSSSGSSSSSGGGGGSSGAPQTVDSSLTAVDATMYLTGNDLWPFTDAKQAILVSALYDHIQVKPIDIRVTKDSLEASKRRRQLRRQLLQDNNSTASQSQTVLTNVQLDPGSAEYLQPVISNLTNITMLTSTLAEACQAKGLNVQSVVLLATVPIVPVLVELNHKVGYIVGPTLAVLAIVAFFGTLLFLHLEKARDLRASRGEKPKASLGLFTGAFWRDIFSPAARKRRAQERAARRAEARAAKEAERAAKESERRAKEAELAAMKKPALPAAAIADEESPATPATARRARLPKLTLPAAGRRPSEGQPPHDTARTPTPPLRTPRSPGVLYVDNI